MLNVYLNYVEIGILLLTILFILVKSLMIKIYTGEKVVYDLFVRSLFLISKQEIKNTFNRKISKYYVLSNIVNKLAYLYYLILMFCYLILVLL